MKTKTNFLSGKSSYDCILILFLIHITFQFQGQNLVKDGSFEHYKIMTEIPNSPTARLDFLENWKSPSLSSPDYFHQKNHELSENDSCFHKPQHGLGFMGMYTLRFDASREYYGQKIKPLQRDSIYVVNFYTKSPYSGIKGAYLELAFISERFKLHGRRIFKKSVLYSVPNVMLEDNNEWIKHTFFYKGTGKESQIAFGCFQKKRKLELETFSSCEEVALAFQGREQRAAYAYFDNLSVIQIPYNYELNLKEFHKLWPDFYQLKSLNTQTPIEIFADAIGCNFVDFRNFEKFGSLKEFLKQEPFTQIEVNVSVFCDDPLWENKNFKINDEILKELIDFGISDNRIVVNVSKANDVESSGMDVVILDYIFIE